MVPGIRDLPDAQGENRDVSSFKLVTSRENPRIKRIARLFSDRGERDRSGLFAAEGVRLCMDALMSGLTITEAYITQKALESRPETARIIGAAGGAYLITEAVAQKISDTKTPQGVFAVCEKRVCQRPETHAVGARYLLLASLQDPGNVGAIIRTAEAFGLSGVVMSADCPDLYGPKVLRATMGGAFRLNVRTVEDMLSEIEDLKSGGVTVWAAAPAATAKTLGSARFDGACAVLLGNEGAGLASELVEVCHAAVSIPMAGRADSLGVAMAAGIFAWEMTR